MKNSLLLFLITSLSFFAYSSQKSKKVAIVKIVRGNATFIKSDGSSAEIKKDMWLNEGSIIKTGARSFLRLSFIDKSSMNIGPKSELKIEKFSQKEAGVINVLTGQIRSQVTKDYLKMDKDKSKLFIKSRNAVMGVRGTDFLFSANKVTGSATTVLFEGKIIFNNITKDSDIGDLEGIVNRGRTINPGEVSVANKDSKRVTVPAKLSTKQFKSLNKNKEFNSASLAPKKATKSIVPAGLNGQVVASDNQSLKASISNVAKINVSEISPEDKKRRASYEDSKGFTKGDDIRPADGIMVHIETGTMIPQGSDSKYDKNTGEWISSTNGSINKSGEYIPPKGFQLADDGSLWKVNPDNGKKIGKVDLVIGLPVDKTQSIEDIKVKPIKKKSDFKDGGPKGSVEVLIRPPRPNGQRPVKIKRVIRRKKSDKSKVRARFRKGTI